MKDPSDKSGEDAIGPAWSEPWGCCFGDCDTETSIAFREYHNLTKDECLHRARRDISAYQAQGSMMTEDELKALFKDPP